MRRIRGYFKLARIEHGIMVVFAVLAGILASDPHYPINNITQTSLLLFSSLMIEINLFTLNDIANIAEDRINAPHRPLVSGEISIREAMFLAMFSLTMSVVPILALGRNDLLLIAFFSLLLGNSYNFFLKKTGFIGNLIVSLITSMPFVYGSLLPFPWFANMPPQIFLFFTMSFLSTLGREVVKGIIDLQGDLAAGVRTIAVLYGRRVAITIASLLFLMAVALSAVAIILVKNIVLYGLSVAIVDLLFIHSTILLWKGVFEKVRKMTLAAMSLGILSFALSNL